MNDNDLNKTPEQKEYREGDARFDVTSLDEVKDENGNGIFHMTTRFKWILALSILLLIVVGVLIYSAYKDALQVEVWQLAIWCVCAVLGFYSVVKRSLAAVILNYILFFGVSLIPAWQMGYEFFRPVIEKLTGIK